jgi:hypothetical protein
MHKEFLNIQIRDFQKSKSVLYDVKGIYRADADGSL